MQTRAEKRERQWWAVRCLHLSWRPIRCQQGCGSPAAVRLCHGGLDVEHQHVCTVSHAGPFNPAGSTFVLSPSQTDTRSGCTMMSQQMWIISWCCPIGFVNFQNMCFMPTQTLQPCLLEMTFICCWISYLHCGENVIAAWILFSESIALR